nr:hypothetical protein OG781_00075 [Streptomyces sp. NBC_00830]WTB35908.1 hypothetical protein OG781_46510 [Streptomyces sp. NBC_00830]
MWPRGPVARSRGATWPIPTLRQRIVWLMPGAFFVVTERNRLQWSEDGMR